MIKEQIYTVPVVSPHIPKTCLKVSVPGSKSITNRALLLATLAQGESFLKGVLFSEDAVYFQKCIQALGFPTEIDEEQKTIRITGYGGTIPKEETSVYVGSAGTAARFLSACLGLSKGTYHMDSSEQMKKRPMAPLLTCLRELGCEISFEEKEGFFPFTLTASGIHKESVCVNIDNSSQFLSALLISSVLFTDDFCIRVVGHHGMAYVNMTVQMMKLKN